MSASLPKRFPLRTDRQIISAASGVNNGQCRVRTHGRGQSGGAVNDAPCDSPASRRCRLRNLRVPPFSSSMIADAKPEGELTTRRCSRWLSTSPADYVLGTRNSLAVERV